MCVDPATATIAMIVAGSAAAAAGDIVQSNAGADAANFNAASRLREARRVSELGAVEEQNVRRRNRRALGQQTADLAAAGRDPTSGSALEVAVQSAEQGELDALNVRTEAILRGDALRTDAALERQRARSARITGPISAAGRLLQGGQRIAALQ